MAERRRYPNRFSRWIEHRFGGHVRRGRLVIYGFNAMHVAVNYRTRRWGYLCFHPTIRCFGVWWPWYFYVSPNATPWAATFAIGPGMDREDRLMAPVRRRRFGGLYFDSDALSDELFALNQAGAPEFSRA